jgi:hypothetical protein
MPPVPKTFQYSNPDQLTPEVISANVGGLPAQIGQILNNAFTPQNAGRNVMGGGFNLPTSQPMQYNTRGTPMPGVLPPKQPSQPAYSMTTPALGATSQQGAYVGSGVYLPAPGVQTFAQSQGHPDPGLIMRLANANPEEFAKQVAAMTPDQRDAIERLTSQQAGGGTVTNAAGTGSAEFMNTGFMQEYAANGTPFEKQLRWDPDRKKHVQIGKLIAEGKLDIRTGKMRRVQTRRGGSGGGSPAARTTSQGALISMGVVNFNISSG